jgi:N-acetylglucosaminylphosphatidylinositol deacetylase
MAWVSPSFDISRRHVYIVIAHPDDEAMFFGPLLITCQAQSCKTSIICLSTGNAEGLGTTRSKELLSSAAMFGIPRERVYIIDHDELRDGMDQVWSSHLIADLLIQNIEISNDPVIITFDELGVSYHPNHIATHRGVVLALSRLRSTVAVEAKATLVQGYKLQSTNVFRKFLGVFDLVFTFSSSSDAIIVTLMHFCLIWRAMCAHLSQLMWYRIFFIICSRFTYMNTLIEI